MMCQEKEKERAMIYLRWLLTEYFRIFRVESVGQAHQESSLVPFLNTKPHND